LYIIQFPVNVISISIKTYLLEYAKETLIFHIKKNESFLMTTIKI